MGEITSEADHKESFAFEALLFLKGYESKVMIVDGGSLGNYTLLNTSN
jgi:hypothetical protein